MIKKLKRKFIFVSMTSVAAVLVLLLGGLDIASYLQMCSNADARLSIVVNVGGNLSMMQGGRAQSQQMPFMQNVEQQGIRAFGTTGLAEIPFDTRFFMVKVKDGDRIAEVNVDNVAAIDADEARTMGAAVIASKATRGFFKNYRYVDTEIDGERTIVFLDVSRELLSFRMLVLTSMGGAAVGLMLLFLVLLPLSAFAIKPIVASQERQRRFVTDASHELKTPLDIISSSTDVIELENGVSEWTQSIRNQVMRLSDLTAKLIALAKADEGPRALNLKDFNLSAIAEQAVDDFAPVTKAGGYELVTAFAPNIICHGDQNLVKLVLNLLLDNALKYADEGGHIRLSISAHRSAHAELRVWNTLTSH